jgi:hypothetical protein
LRGWPAEESKYPTLDLNATMESFGHKKFFKIYGKRREGMDAAGLI